MIQTISSTKIDTKRKETIAAQNLRKTVSFRDINVIDSKTIEYKGTRIGVSNQGFKSLLKMIGMSNQFANKFETLFNSEAKAAFINRIKDAMASNSGRFNTITMVLNPVSKTIVHIGKDESSSISNEQFLNVSEGIISGNSMDVTNWSIDPINGEITINAFNPNAQFGIKGLSDEVFTGGITFKNSPIKGFQVLPYVNRMWCANGLTTQMSDESYTLRSLDNVEMEKFFQNLNKLRKNNFASTSFESKVNNAINTPASLKEMLWAHGQLSKFAGERAENWIPLNENMSKYKSMGYENLTSDQMASAKTNQSVWSVVNGLTHFATHGSNIIQTNMQDQDATRMMISAGNLFGKKKYDHLSLMPNPFDADVLNQSTQIGALLN